jgi:hypothetical protein
MSFNQCQVKGSETWLSLECIFLGYVTNVS